MGTIETRTGALDERGRVDELDRRLAGKQATKECDAPTSRTSGFASAVPTATTETKGSAPADSICSNRTVASPMRSSCNNFTADLRHPSSLCVLPAETWELHVEMQQRGCLVVPEPPSPEDFLTWLTTSTGLRLAPEEPAECVLNVDLRTLSVGHEIVQLQPRETQLLRVLQQNTERWLSSEELCALFLGCHARTMRKLLWQHLHSLRGKLGRLGVRISYHKGRGYRSFLRVKVVDAQGRRLADHVNATVQPLLGSAG